MAEIRPHADVFAEQVELAAAAVAESVALAELPHGVAMAAVVPGSPPADELAQRCSRSGRDTRPPRSRGAVRSGGVNSRDSGVFG
jgi:hypothetical protein